MEVFGYASRDGNRQWPPGQSSHGAGLPASSAEAHHAQAECLGQSKGIGGDSCCRRASVADRLDLAAGCQAALSWPCPKVRDHRSAIQPVDLEDVQQVVGECQPIPVPDQAEQQASARSGRRAASERHPGVCGGLPSHYRKRRRKASSVHQREMVKLSTTTVRPYGGAFLSQNISF